MEPALNYEVIMIILLCKVEDSYAHMKPYKGRQKKIKVILSSLRWEGWERCAGSQSLPHSTSTPWAALRILPSNSSVWVGSRVQGEGPYTTQQFSGHHLGVLQFNSTLALSTWSQFQITQVKGSVPQGCPPGSSGASHKFMLPPVLLTEGDPTSLLTLESVYLQEQLIELSKPIYLLDDQFITKNINGYELVI